MMPYWIDSNVFINAANNHYGMQFCPAFWEWITQAHFNGYLKSVSSVKDEINERESDVKEWTNNLPTSFFVPNDTAALQAYIEITRWVANRDCYQSAKDEFLAKADPRLIAQAMAHGGTVVTHEIPAPKAKRTIKIPDVCDYFQVDWIEPFEMLRRENPRFILEA